MAIITITTDVAGQTGGFIGGVAPRRVAITTTDSLGTITTPGYLNQAARETFVIKPTDICDIQYAYNVTTHTGSFGMFTVTISGTGVITLTAWSNSAAGDVTFTGTPVAGDFVIWNNSTGTVEDLGYLPSNAAKTNVVMANGATIVNHIGTFTDTAGTLGEDAATAINGGNIQAGLSGTAGTLASFPATATKGSLVVAAVANTGNTTTTISNAAMGQASVISIPDPGAATANFVLNTGTTTMAAGSSIVLAKGTGTEAANAVTVNAQAGVITTSSLTTAGGSSYAITWTNSFIASTSVILLTIMGGTNTTENITLKATAGAGTSTLTIYNNTAATALNGTILIGFAVF